MSFFRIMALVMDLMSKATWLPPVFALLLGGRRALILVAVLANWHYCYFAGQGHSVANKLEQTNGGEFQVRSLLSRRNMRERHFNVRCTRRSIQ
jgi:hypothetical protein